MERGGEDDKAPGLRLIQNQDRNELTFDILISRSIQHENAFAPRYGTAALLRTVYRSPSRIQEKHRGGHQARSFNHPRRGLSPYPVPRGNPGNLTSHRNFQSLIFAMRASIFFLSSPESLPVASLENCLDTSRYLACPSSPLFFKRFTKIQSETQRIWYAKAKLLFAFAVSSAFIASRPLERAL